MVAPNAPRPDEHRVARFPLGRVSATPAALEALEQAGQEPVALLHRHQCGNWGQVGSEDAAANEEAVASGCRLLSSYTLSTGVTVWVITEGDRRATTILLPDEY